MSWWGKLLGGTVGFVLGGPLGAVAGAALGHGLDRGLDGRGLADAAREGLSDRERTQTAFFTATFSVMGHIAKSDGRVTPDEIRMATTIMDRLRLGPDLRRLARDLFTQGKASDFPLDEVIDQFRRECRHNRNLVRLFLEIQLQAAYADGSLQIYERRILSHVARRLGYSEMQLARLDAMVRAGMKYWQGSRDERRHDALPSLEDAYAILNTTPASSDSEVKHAYRRLMSEHHPDKLVARGLPEEMMRVATEKTQEIKAAYDRIRDARGLF